MKRTFSRAASDRVDDVVHERGLPVDRLRYLIFGVLHDPPIDHGRRPNLEVR
jgi:hypothetical protein